MIFFQQLTDHAGALYEPAIVHEAHVMHGVKNTAMHRLEAVANVGQRAADDHRHRVVEIRPPHLLFNVDRLNIERTRTTIAGRRSQGKLGILVVRHKERRCWLLALATSSGKAAELPPPCL